MIGEERRQCIVEILTAADAPVSGQALASELAVSRQIIVQDIALLRTAGRVIASTNRGYVLEGESAAEPVRLVKVKHTQEQIEDELNRVVDLGGCVMDVMVNHRTYGPITAPLDIKSRRDVRHFLDDLAAGISAPLSTVTDGYHFHHISAESEEILDEIVADLDAAGYIAPLTAFERDRF